MIDTKIGCHQLDDRMLRSTRMNISLINGNVLHHMFIMPLSTHFVDRDMGKWVDALFLWNVLSLTVMVLINALSIRDAIWRWFMDLLGTYLSEI